MVEWYECCITSAPHGGYEVSVRKHRADLMSQVVYIKAFSSSRAGLEEAIDTLNKQAEEYIK